MRTKDLPKRIVYLELLDSLLDADGGEARARHRLGRDVPWVYEGNWEIERWGLRRKGNGSSRGGRRLRGPIFPLAAFPRVLLPLVVWTTHFFQAVRRPRAGILIAYSPVAGVGAALARLLRRRSSVLVVRIISDFSARAGTLYGRQRERSVLEAIERFVLRRADVVIPMGAYTRQLAAQAGVPDERILELPHPPRWSGPEVAPPETGEPFRITAAGRLVAEKGFDLLLDAFSRIAEEFPEVQLDVAGDGPERTALQRLAASLGAADRVRFRGWLASEAMPGFFGGALAAVLPSRINEGLGMVLIEAGLMGCALVGSDVGGIRDIVHPGRTGILVQPNDPGALAEALASLLREPERARRLGAGARAGAQAYVARRDQAVRQVRERIEALRMGRRTIALTSAERAPPNTPSTSASPSAPNRIPGTRPRQPFPPSPSGGDRPWQE